MNKYLLVILSALLSNFVWAAEWPAQPTDAQNPGSAVYKSTVEELQLNINGRTVDIIRPGGSGPFPVLVFGHGQAIPLSGYLETFRHLAGKGVAVVFPQFDTGFFDQNWGRMATDFANLAKSAIAQSNGELSSTEVFFSGHSKGAYVGLMAMGLANSPLATKGGVFFAPAGYDAQYLARLNAKVPVTLIWGNEDSIVKPSVGNEIYSKMNIERKQFIHVTSYPSAQPELKADHFFVLSDSFFFGGKKGVSPFHYHGAWKWMIGAVEENDFLYGDAAAATGWEKLNHRIERNF